MNISKLFLIAIAIIPFSCSKEEPIPLKSNNLSFEKTYGGRDYDVANSGVIYKDQLFIIGTTHNKENDSKDIYLLKLDLNGNVLYEKNYGGDGDEEGVEIITTKEGELMLLGSTSKKGDNSKDIVLFLVDELGGEKWMKTFGGASNEVPADIIETASGNIILLGATDSQGAGSGDIYLIKLDQSGNTLWSRLYGETDLDAGAGLLLEENGDIMLFGYTKNYGAVSRDYYLMRLTSSGDSLWARRYGGIDYEESQEIVKTAEGGFLMIGHSASTDPIHNMYAVKVNSTGLVLWEKNYGGILHDGGQAVLINTEGKYVFVARSDSYGMGQGIYMVTTDVDGNILQENVFDGPKDDRVDKILEYEDSYFLIGQSNSFGDGDYDIYVIKHPK